MTSNPWDVDSLEAFTFFCCPECDYKSRESMLFEGHALKNHPMSFTFFGGQEEDYLEEDSDDKSRLYFDSENYIKSEPMDDYHHHLAEESSLKDDEENKIDIKKEFDQQKTPSKKESKPSTCLVCQEEFPTSIQMKRHRKSKHSGEVKCKTCHKTFTTYALLTNHTRNGKCDSKGEPSTCLVCQEVFPTTAMMKNHRKNQHPGSVQCRVCSVNFPNCRKLYDHHYKCHSSRIQCDLCSKTFVTSAVYRRHYENVHKAKEESKVYQCDKCSYNTIVERNLMQHQDRVHYEGPSSICPYCSKECGSRTSLSCHISSRHTHVRNTKTEAGSTFKCMICKDQPTFKNNSAYLLHYRFAHNDLPPECEGIEKVYCDQCGKWFASDYNLKIHVQTYHEGKYQPSKNGKRYACQLCEKTYSTKSNLDEHVLSVHEKNTPYECDLCPRKFGLQSKLRSHKSNVHTEAICEICKKDLPNKTDLSRHQMKVHGVVPKGAIQCPYCPLVFKIQSSLDKHVKNKHLDNMNL